MSTTIKNHLKPLPGTVGDFFKSAGGASAISGGGGIFTSLINGSIQKKENQRERNWQEDMYALQLQHNREDATTAFNRQKELIQDEREYQSIGAQAERARAAGIHPLAALGASSGGGYSSVQTSSPASVGSPNTRAPQVDNFFADAVAGYVRGAEAENIEADTKKKEAEAKSLQLANDKEEFMRESGAWIDEYEKGHSESETSKAKAQIAHFDVLREQAASAYYDVNAAANSREIVSRADKAVAETNRVLQEIENLRKDGIIKDEEANKLRQEFRTEVQRTILLKYEQTNKAALTRLANSKADNLDRQTELLIDKVIADYIKVGADAAKAINDIIATWVPNPKMAQKIIEKFKKKESSSQRSAEFAREKYEDDYSHLDGIFD